ncbi:MAG: response regulator [Spartobacteria bacterium]
MPANPPPSDSENRSRGILLVEEYSNLGVAVASALRKFAPLHTVQVARDFAEAEELATTIQAELFVIDLDPPPRGEIEFFYKLRNAYPDARVLVFAAGTSRELRAERGTAGAIQFMEKPFDLEEFGAAVQALLGPWNGMAGAVSRGTLRQLHAIDILQLKCLAGSTTVVRVESRDDEIGDIYFQKGQISHAVVDTVTGLAALEKILHWPAPRMSEGELPSCSPRTIEGAWATVLLQMVRTLHAEHRRPAPGENPVAQPGKAPNGKKILVIDDTEMLLIFVADVLATADRSFQIFTASSGRQGLRTAASERPDLILLDYSLADITGDLVCAALLANPATERLPVLMMSGHLSELAKTAEEYANVVAAMPKPFLSGALINAVEKALAAGPLPPSPRSKSNSGGSSTSAAEARADNAKPASPNGHGFKSAPAEPPPPEQTASSPPAKALALASRTEALGSSPATGATAARRTELSVTLALKVLALEFGPSLRVETAALELFDAIASVKMREQKELGGVPLESGFRLGKVALDEAGRIETMRLVPIHRPPQLPVPHGIFAVGASDFQRSNGKLRLAASEEAAMHVRLTAQFELQTAELSAGFDVAALLLKAISAPLFIRNGPEDAGRAFELVEVQRTPAGELQRLVVRATS